MKTLSDFNFEGKKVLLRADFNVPIKDAQVLDDFRIVATLPTIDYLLKQNAKIILLTHLGRPKGQVKEDLRVDLIGQRLEQLLNKKVKKLNEWRGDSVRQAVAKMQSGDIILLENVQFDVGETQKSDDYAKELASLADFFVLDAFGQAHRDYATISGIPKYLPSCAGLLLAKEIEILSKLMTNPVRPLVSIIGGAKISTKIKLIKNLLNKSDNLVLGGALANTVISAKGFAIGKSLTEKSMIEEVKKLELTNTKLNIPVDVIASVSTSGQEPLRVAPVGNTQADELILDIGPDTIHIFTRIIQSAKTIIWNGPMGYFESAQFSQGTEAVAKAIATSDNYSVVGGGETVDYLNDLGLKDKFDHISSGGGAMLAFLSGEKMPGLEALK